MGDHQNPGTQEKSWGGVPLAGVSTFQAKAGAKVLKKKKVYGGKSRGAQTFADQKKGGDRCQPKNLNKNRIELGKDFGGGSCRGTILGYREEFKARRMQQKEQI